MSLNLSLHHKHRCSICAELAGKDDTLLAQLLLDERIVSAVALRTENFAVIPSIGALVAGHSLIVPLSHEPNVLLHAKTNGLLDELLGLLTRHTALNKSSYLLFEHGTTSLGNSLCSTEHGHLHVLPLRADQLEGVFAQLKARDAELTQFSELPKRAREEKNFIYACDLNAICGESLAYVLPAAGIPSQFLRQVVANVVGSNTWNWKVDPAKDLVKATIKWGFVLKTRSVSAEPC